MSDSEQYPDFFIVGAQRSGTTSLYEYLRAHPRVFMSAHKEPHFFSHDRVRMDRDLYFTSEAEYLKLFASAQAGQRVGEASPSYLWHPDAAQRIHAERPHAKIIVILRNPIERAYSQYRMDLADGLAPISFPEAVQREYEHGDKVYGTGHLYVELGLYAAQVARYVGIFGRERVLLLSFRDWASGRNVLRRVAQFLEIDAAGFENVETSVVHNQIGAPRNAAVNEILRMRSLRQTYRALIPPGLRRMLREKAFVSAERTTPDPEAVEYLRALYLPDWEKFTHAYGEFYSLDGK